jgi:hypothetical protein
MPKVKFALKNPQGLEFKIKEHGLKIYDVDSILGKFKIADNREFQRLVGYDGFVESLRGNNLDLDARFVFGIVDPKYLTGKDIGNRIFCLGMKYVDMPRNFDTAKYWQNMLQVNQRSRYVANEHVTKKILASEKYHKKLVVKKKDIEYPSSYLS